MKLEKIARPLAAGLILANSLCYLLLALALFFVVIISFGEYDPSFEAVLLFAVFILVPFVFFVAGIVSALLISNKSKKARIVSTVAEFVPMFLFPGYFVLSVLTYPPAVPGALDPFLLFAVLSVAGYAVILFLFYGKKTKKLFD